MNLYAIGDLHLSFDERIEKPMDIFGPRWKDHYRKLEENWREIVRENDAVIIPGDISWGLRLDEALADLEWVHNLPGKKILTKGNHDLWWMGVGKLNRLHSDMVFLQNTSIETAPGVYVCGSRGWICPGTEGFSEHDEKIYKRELLRLEFSLKEAQKQNPKAIIAALHYPPTNDKMQGSGFTDLMERYGVKTCIYGHLHGKEAFKNGMQGVFNGVEYRLVSLDYLECTPKLIYEE